jgi:hypothetical protein
MPAPWILRQVSLRYERSVRSPLFDAEAMGNLNDLVVVGEEGQEEIYVTHYRAFPDGAEGRYVKPWLHYSRC